MSISVFLSVYIYIYLKVHQPNPTHPKARKQSQRDEQPLWRGKRRNENKKDHRSLLRVSSQLKIAAELLTLRFSSRYRRLTGWFHCCALFVFKCFFWRTVHTVATPIYIYPSRTKLHFFLAHQNLWNSPTIRIQIPRNRVQKESYLTLMDNDTHWCIDRALKDRNRPPRYEATPKLSLLLLTSIDFATARTSPTSRARPRCGAAYSPFLNTLISIQRLMFSSWKCS